MLPPRSSAPLAAVPAPAVRMDNRDGMVEAGRTGFRRRDPSVSARRRRLDPERAGDHVDRLYRAAWALCGSREDAEDLVQEVYVKVLARPRWLSGEDDLAYLMRSLHNAYVSRLRRHRPATVSLDAIPELDDQRALRRPEWSVEVGELFAAISALPSPFREA